MERGGRDQSGGRGGKRGPSTWSSTHGIKPQTADDGALAAAPILSHSLMEGACDKIGAATKTKAEPTYGLIPSAEAAHFLATWSVIMVWDWLWVGKNLGGSLKIPRKPERMEARPYFLAFEGSSSYLFDLKSFLVKV